MKALGVVFLVVIAIASGLLYGRSQREQGILRVQRDSAHAATARAERRADSADAVAAAKAVDARAWRAKWEARPTRWDTLALTDTVSVTVRELVTADSAINSCHVGLDACEAARVTREAVIDSLRIELELTEKLDLRPRTAIGASYNPHTSQWGAFVDRDFWKLRGGVTVEPAEQGLRVGVRIGWVF